MKIHIVSKVVDREDEQSTTTVSVHIDADRAETRRKAIDDVREYMTYGVIETAELDLTGDGAALQQLRDEVIRQQARLARGRRG